MAIARSSQRRFRQMRERLRIVRQLTNSQQQVNVRGKRQPEADDDHQDHSAARRGGAWMRFAERDHDRKTDKEVQQPHQRDRRLQKHGYGRLTPGDGGPRRCLAGEDGPPGQILRIELRRCHENQQWQPHPRRNVMHHLLGPSDEHDAAERHNRQQRKPGVEQHRREIAQPFNRANQRIAQRFSGWDCDA